MLYVELEKLLHRPHHPLSANTRYLDKIWLSLLNNVCISHEFVYMFCVY